MSVGTHTQSFDRFLKEVDRLAGEKKIKNIVAVIGNSAYEPKNCRWYRFVDYEKYTEFERKSNVIVVHAGIGSIMSALDLGKPVVVVPRQAKFGEHVDNHQVYTAKELEKQGKIIAVYDIKDLYRAIKKAKTFKPVKSRSSTILDILKQKFNEWG